MNITVIRLIIGHIFNFIFLGEAVWALFKNEYGVAMGALLMAMMFHKVLMPSEKEMEKLKADKQ